MSDISQPINRPGAYELLVGNRRRRLARWYRWHLRFISTTALIVSAYLQGAGHQLGSWAALAVALLIVLDRRRRTRAFERSIAAHPSMVTS